MNKFLLDELVAATDADLFEVVIRKCGEAWGFPLFTSAIVQQRTETFADWFQCMNVPAAFREASRDPVNGRRDPVQQRSKSTSAPFAWNRSFYAQANTDDLWEEQAPFDYHAGIAIAMHLPAGLHFLLSFDRREPLPLGDDDRMNRMLADLALMATYAVGVAQQVLAPSTPKVTGTLTPREREALSWTLEGKTAWEVGGILSISERTAVMHLQNASRKLGASNKVQAALNARRLYMI